MRKNIIKSLMLLSALISNGAQGADPCNQVFDVIIVGLGNAGSVLANRLTEDPNLRVLVIEGGRDDTRVAPILPLDLPNPMPNKANSPWSVLPRLGPLATYGQNLAQGFDGWQHMPLLRDDPNSRYIFYSRGSSWGGSTIHNAGVALRGHSEIYDEWDVIVGSPGIWDYNALIPYFKRMENRGMATAPFDPTTLYFNPALPITQLGTFDPATQGLGGPVTLMWFTLVSDPLATALKNTASVGPNPFGVPPGFPFPVDVDPDNQSFKQYLTSQAETGYDQFSPDFPALDPYGTGPVSFPNIFGPLSGVTPRVQRGHAAGYYVYPIEDRPNLTIIDEALVTKIIFDNQKRAIGVQYLEGWNIYQAGRQMNTSRAGIGGTPSDAAANAEKALAAGPKVARASKEVVLCGGTYNSPQVLLLSGVGPRGDLEALGINVIQDLPGVGQHLVDHAETDITWFHETPFDFFAEIGAGRLPQSGLMTFDFISDNTKAFGDFSAHIYPGGVVTGWGGIGDIMDSFIGNARYDGPPQYIYPEQFPMNYQRYDPPLNVQTHTSILLEQRADIASQGFVKLRSANPTDQLYIVMNLLLDPADMQAYVNAFRDTIAPFVQNLSAQAPSFFDAWVAPTPADFLTAGNVLLADKSNFNQPAFEQWVLKHLWAHHASGTCKMGLASDPMAVVDARLRVHGVSRVRVVDCSVFPVIPTSNTMIPAFVLAERAADLIKQDLPAVTPITSINPLVDSLIANYGA